ncbi:2-isopropylmalate synthase [Citrobacter freundii]|nr:2-isopropylmalate synthase [Citrobacter freundii]
MSQQVIIFDTHLTRRVNRRYKASLSVKEKLQIALALERMGG